MTKEVVKKNLGGRPTVITDELLTNLFNYPDDFDLKTDKEGNPVFTTMPTLAEFCSKQGVAQSTIFNRARDLDENGQLTQSRLIEALNKLKAKQEHILTNSSLSGAYKNSFAIFWAKNNLGWADKTETTQNIKVTAKIATLNINMDAQDASQAYKALLDN